ncbi:ATP-dependent zinc metalloprotease YME1L [Patella vulgata]|uniref:ATP-dependent zinc metalloprotease YME1L n=1 Tax=Patella vulgata TaxID=6465 RepID=UPI00217F7884|nr:ATP-dependent zinc metalloprotease YME1L [Patella vulgata]
MASLFSHNAFQPQVLAAFSQLSSIYNGIRTLSQSSASRTSKDKKFKDLQSVESLVNSDLSKELSFEDLPKELTVSQLLDTFTPKKHTEVLSKNKDAVWNESHVSKNTFFENKTGFPSSQLGDNLHHVTIGQILEDKTVQHLLNKGIFNSLFQQQRGFKTVRAGHRGGMGQDPKHTSALDDLKKSVFSKIFPTKESQQKQPELQKLVNEHERNPEFQDKLKVAFAEGYSAREKPASASGSSGSRFGRFIMYGFIIYIIMQVVSLYRGVSDGVQNGFKGIINIGQQFQINPEEIMVTFDDVKGADEAKQELKDVVEFLRDPEKFTVLGAKLPKGVLLVGPPGIGKTLLARAVAGEAQVKFFRASGSEFDEVFVGTGAKRVRQLFKAAKLSAPCVIFIDEIDSVGAKRTSSQIHPYANQTINQLLSEMDGFTQNEGVIVLGATNKRDNLDKALLRAGRFDVEVRVFPPDLKGRKDILEHYMKKVIVDKTVDIEMLAKGTTGFTGADLENMVNQAALKAAIDGSPTVSMNHMEYSRDKVLMGPEKKTKIPDEATNWSTAYHEAGHTLVAYYTKEATPLHKVTIIPRGMALGYTAFIDDKEVYNRTKAQLLAQMDVAMGGRVAEELIYGADQVTTGASGDFQGATRIAAAMVKQFGMSDKVGTRVFEDNGGDGGFATIKVNEVSQGVQDLVDNEIRRLLQESYERATALLKSHSAEHKALAKALMTYETLDKDDIKAVVEGKNLNKNAKIS